MKLSENGPHFEDKDQKLVSEVEENLAYLNKIQEEYDGLSKVQKFLLCKFAEQKVAAFGLFTEGHTGQDLLREALTRIFQGKRKWPERVDFYKMLFETIRSTADNWRKRARRRPMFTESTLKSADSDEPPGYPPEGPPDCDEPAVKAAKERVAEIRALLSDDQEVIQVLDLKLQNLTGPEIQERLNLTNTQYESIMKRFLRKARKLREFIT